MCENHKVKNLLDFGEQPVCNRFLKEPTESEYHHRIMFGQCEECGLLQLTDTAPSKELKPIYDWITYREPEGHLDDLSKTISELNNLKKNSIIGGFSFKDDSLLARLNKLGFKNTWRINLSEDLDVLEKGAGVETIQDVLNEEKAEKIVRKYGKSDILVIRHLLEHVHDIKKFETALKILAKNDSYVVFEVPDCTPALETLDYTTIWEEHTMYFTQKTFKFYCNSKNKNLVYYKLAPYTMENSLVGIVKLGEEIEIKGSNKKNEEEISRAELFASNFKIQQKIIESFLNHYKKTRGKIVIFGAGHLSCKFVNLLNLKELIYCFIDDSKNKQGLYMPGSQLPIKSPEILSEDSVSLCLLGLGEEIQEKIITNNNQFINKGRTFASIFSSGKRSIDKLIKNTRTEKN